MTLKRQVSNKFANGKRYYFWYTYGVNVWRKKMENLFLSIPVYLPVSSWGTFVFRKKASGAAKGACKKKRKK